MYLGELDDGETYVIVEVNWNYNDCWCERDGSRLTDNVFKDYWKARDFCEIENAKEFLEKLIDENRYARNTDLNWKQLLVSNFPKIFELEEYKLVMKRDDINKGSLGRFLMEHGLSKYEIVQIPKGFVISNI